jgi:hypothetical protein
MGGAKMRKIVLDAPEAQQNARWKFHFLAAMDARRLALSTTKVGGNCLAELG